MKKGVLRNFAKFTGKHLCQWETRAMCEIYLKFAIKIPMVSSSLALNLFPTLFWFFHCDFEQVVNDRWAISTKNCQEKED